MRPSVDRTRRHFYAACAVVLGAWEMVALTSRVPTVTATVRARPALRPLVALWLGGLSVHLLRRRTL